MSQKHKRRIAKQSDERERTIAVLERPANVSKSRTVRIAALIDIVSLMYRVKQNLIEKNKKDKHPCVNCSRIPCYLVAFLLFYDTRQ